MELLGNQYLTVGSIIILAALIQSTTGFGFAIVAMSFLPEVISLSRSAPLVALVSIVGNLVIWYHYRRDCSFKVVGKLTLASLIATPLGTILLARLPEAIALKGLGILIVGYVLYDWFNLSLPSLNSSNWAYLFGGLSGILNGAYTVGGPPVIIYANCRRWSPSEFKGNLTALFFPSSVMAAIAHAWQGNINESVWRFAIYSLPGYAGGLWVGIVFSNLLNPVVFRRITLALLLAAGLRMLI